MAEVFGVPYELDTSTLLNGTFALVLGLFALVVGFLARFRGPAKWYAWFGISFGLSTFTNNLAAGFLIPFYIDTWTADVAAIPHRSLLFVTGMLVIQAVTGILTGLAIAGLMRSYGVDNPLRQWKHWIFPLALFASGYTSFLTDPSLAGIPSWFEWALGISLLPSYFGIAWMGNAAIFMASAYLRDRQAGQAILAAAMSAYPILWGATNVADGLLVRTTVPLFDYAVLASVALWMAIAWWRAYDQTRTRGARRVAWLPAVWIAFAIAMAVWTTIPTTVGGFARAFDVLLVGYAILRLHYLGLDVKVRWGISKTTVAALFVAVFFVVSEGAQTLFSERWGPALGIFAAGTLVFGMSPIMRFADQFAERAVPRAKAQDTFAAAVRAALADGVISPKEEMYLAQVAEGLGLTPTQTQAVRSEIGA